MIGNSMEAPGVGGGQISREVGMRTGGPHSYAKFLNSIRKAHLGTTSDTRLFSGEQRNSHFKRVKSVHDPMADETEEVYFANSNG